MVRNRSFVMVALLAIALSALTACGKGSPTAPSGGGNNTPPVNLSLSPQAFVMYPGGQMTIAAQGVNATTQVSFSVAPAACGRISNQNPAHPYEGTLVAGMEERTDCQVTATASGSQAASSFSIASATRIELLNKDEVCNQTFDYGTKPLNIRIQFVTPVISGVDLVVFYEDGSGTPMPAGMRYPPAISSNQGEVVYTVPTLGRGTSANLVMRLQTGSGTLQQVSVPCVVNVR